MNTLPFEGFDALSESEKKAFVLLNELEHDSIWGIAIRNVCNCPDVMRFRRLICDLKSQAADCADTMRNILGRAYDHVISL